MITIIIKILIQNNNKTMIILKKLQNNKFSIVKILTFYKYIEMLLKIIIILNYRVKISYNKILILY